MKALQRIPLVLGLIMICGAVAAHVIRPAMSLAKPLSSMQLSAIIPEHFGDWQMTSMAGPVVLPTELERVQKQIYDQLLVRTYVDKNGNRIMLSIAYGSNQSKALQVHRPEVCYSAMGFQILNKKKAVLSGFDDNSEIPIMHLVAAKDLRNEPITYWIRIGDQVVRGYLELGTARVGYGLRGYVPDGLLFRVSTITNANNQGFELEDRFVREMIHELGQEQRELLLGRSTHNSTSVAGG